MADTLTANALPAERRPAAIAPPRTQGASRARPALAMVAPAIILMCLLLLGPLLGVIALSFTDYQLGSPTFAWIGLENYREMLADRVFWTSLRNTLTYVAIVVPAAVALGLSVALLIESGSSLARLVPHHLLPAGHGNADRDVDRLGIHAASAVRPGERVAARNRARGLQLAAGPSHGALCALRDRHLAGARLQHGAVPRRAGFDPPAALRRRRNRWRSRPLGAVPAGDMADAGADHGIRRGHHRYPFVSGVRHRPRADQGRAVEIVRSPDPHHVCRRLRVSSVRAMARH